MDHVKNKKWMKENFKACHIFLLRDPLQQWISYLERWKKKDIYFFNPF